MSLTKIKPIKYFYPNSNLNYMIDNIISIKNTQETLESIVKDRYEITISYVKQYAIENIEKIINLLNNLECILLMENSEEEEAIVNNSITTNDVTSAYFYIADKRPRTGLGGHIYTGDLPKGRVIGMLPSSHLKPVTGLNQLFEQENKKIEVYTVHNQKKLYFEAYTMPTVTDFIRMKLIQWELFKDSVKEYDPRIEAFYKAILDERFDDFNTILKSIETSQTIKTYEKNKITKFFKIDYETKKETLRNRIKSYYASIEEEKKFILENINEIKKRKREIKMLEMTEGEQENVEFIVDYIQNSPYIVNLKDIEGEDWVEIEYEAPLIYYDKYAIDDIYENQEPYEQKILDIFKEENYELMVRAKVAFNRNDFRTVTKTVNRDDFFLRHPHIDRWGCLGNHTDAIFESAESGDYIGALDQITQAVLNLNFYDGTVVQELFHNLFDIEYETKLWRKKNTDERYSTSELLGRS